MRLSLLILAILAALFLFHHREWFDRPAEPAVPVIVAVAERGDVNRLERLLTESEPVDSRDFCRWTPLMKAALNGHREVVERLLAAGAGVELADKGGYTALMLAASNDHADIVQLLLEYGADPNAVERTQGFTALAWAASLGNLESIRVLLTHGASITITDREGRTPLELAQEGGHEAVVALLSASLAHP